MEKCKYIERNIIAIFFSFFIPLTFHWISSFWKALYKVNDRALITERTAIFFIYTTPDALREKLREKRYPEYL